MSGKRADHLQRLVLRCAVDDQKLQRPIRLGEHRLDGLTDETALVVAGHDYRDQGLLVLQGRESFQGLRVLLSSV